MGSQKMTPEGLNSLYLEYQHDDDMPRFSEAQFTLPLDLTAALGRHGDESASQRSLRGPRGGKKPLRPRQQQVTTLEAELEQKLLDLRAAQAERERLQQRIKILEVILPVRERFVQMLEQRREAPNASPSAHVHALGAGQHVNVQCSPELRVSASIRGFLPGSEAGRSSDTPHELGAEPTASPAAPIEVIQSSAESARIALHADTFTSNRIAFFTSVPAHNDVPGQVLRQTCGMWKQWMREAGLILHAHDARPHDPGPQLKLGELYKQLAPQFCSLRLDHPSLRTELMCVNMETGEREEPPPDSYWIPVAQGLRLSPVQVADAKAALALYKERAAKALDDRRRLAAKLDSHLASLQMRAPQQGSVAGQLAGPDKCGQLVLEVDEVAGQLYRNVMVQGDTLDIMKDFLGSGLFSLVQMVRAGVLSYPYFPDVIGILSSVDASPSCPANGREAVCGSTCLHGLPALQLH